MSSVTPVVRTIVSLCFLSAGLDVCEHNLPGLSATVSPEVLAISPKLQLPSLRLPHFQGTDSHSRTVLRGPRTLTSLNICCLTQPSRFRSHHGILKVQGSIAAAIIVIIIAIAACGLATFFLMRMRSRRMNQVYTPLLLTL